MSYSETTTHFNWPLPVETDLFNGLDDNQMKEDLDEKIYNLEQRSTGDHEAVTQLNTKVTEVEQTVGGYGEQLEELEGTVGEHAERLVNLTNRQTELSRRLNGKASEATIAPEYNEEESYSVGDFVYHNNILYKATSASATPAGAFDANNWDIVILTNELGGSTPGSVAAADVSFDDTTAQLGANSAQGAIDALKTLVDNSTIKNASSDVTITYNTEQTRSIGSLATVFPTLTGLTVNKVKSLLCVNTTDSTPLVGMLDKDGGITTKSFVDLSGQHVIKVSITYID